MTLIELLGSIVMAITVLSAVLNVVMQHGRLRRSDGELGLALVACKNSLEELRATPFTQLPSMDGMGFGVTTMSGDACGLMPLPEDADGLPGSLAVSVEASAGGRTLYRVKAQVDWLCNGERQHLELETLMGDRPLR